MAFRRYAELREDGEIGRLAIQKFGGHQTQLRDVIAWVERIEDKWSDPIDAIVIDYADSEELERLITALRDDNRGG